MSRIPDNITRDHVLQAVKEIDTEGIPKARKSTKFEIEIGRRRYPPKYLISLANKYANDCELESTYFFGGVETNSFLSKLGFKVVLKDGIPFPIESHSWRVISPFIFIKKIDKSSFLYKGTSIPMRIKEFLGIENLKSGDKVGIVLVHRDLEYQAYFTMDIQQVPRARLFWHSSFTKILKHELPEWFHFFRENNFAEEPPLLRFQLSDTNRYNVEIIDPKSIELDIRSESDDNTPVFDGAVKYYYSKVYERKPENRKRAIEIHGLQCAICRFDFERHYGARGAGFIEIHHTKPLSAIGEEVLINPETDLVPVCSNCHRMIHRSKDKVLTINELKALYKE